MDLNEVAIFIKVIQTRSFSQAALQLGMPNSTVSSKISSLEKRLGITLIQRTTRRLNITAAGEAYYKRCVKGIQEIELAENELASNQNEPQGLIRITAPVELGNTLLPEIVSRYIKQYPKVSVELILTDRTTDLLTENIDLAIRAGHMKDSTLIVKKLGAVSFAAFASLKYLKLNGNPLHPKELKNHQCLHFTPQGISEWKLVSSKGLQVVPAPGRVFINDLNIVKGFAIAGQGIALLPTFNCYADILAGKLVRILPEWRTQVSPVHFAYPGQKFVTSKLSAFILLASDHIKKNLQDFDKI